MKVAQITFPKFSGIRCLMMPYVQGEPDSVPEQYRGGYTDILNSVYIKKGDIGFLTIDESQAKKGIPHRGQRAKFERALHTEAGKRPNKIYAWGNTWGDSDNVILDPETDILIANNLDNSCAYWNATHKDTSEDGDIGDCANMYPYSEANYMKAGEVQKIGILTPHESLPVKEDFNRQFLRILSSGVYGREPYFTENPLVPI